LNGSILQGKGIGVQPVDEFKVRCCAGIYIDLSDVRLLL
jgi:hypothetical protein